MCDVFGSEKKICHPNQIDRLIGTMTRTQWQILVGAGQAMTRTKNSCKITMVPANLSNIYVTFTNFTQWPVWMYDCSGILTAENSGPDQPRCTHHTRPNRTSYSLLDYPRDVRGQIHHQAYWRKKTLPLLIVLLFIDYQTFKFANYTRGILYRPIVWNNWVLVVLTFETHLFDLMDKIHIFFLLFFIISNKERKLLLSLHFLSFFTKQFIKCAQIVSIFTIRLIFFPWS